jgi:hypothetical protein
MQRPMAGSTDSFKIIFIICLIMIMVWVSPVSPWNYMMNYQIAFTWTMYALIMVSFFYFISQYFPFFTEIKFRCVTKVILIGMHIFLKALTRTKLTFNSKIIRYKVFATTPFASEPNSFTMPRRMFLTNLAFPVTYFGAIFLWVTFSTFKLVIADWARFYIRWWFCSNFITMLSTIYSRTLTATKLLSFDNYTVSNSFRFMTLQT